MCFRAIIVLSCACLLIACTKHQPSNQTTEQDSVATSVELVSDEMDTTCAAIPEEPLQTPIKEEKATTQRQTPSSRSSQPTSSSYSSYSEEESGDYWEEKRKHSPNDNYLLGFDEDVDDVHDMELYMDDY